MSVIAGDGPPRSIVVVLRARFEALALPTSPWGKAEMKGVR
jgi:hypothetical protein